MIIFEAIGIVYCIKLIFNIVSWLYNTLEKPEEGEMR